MDKQQEAARDAAIRAFVNRYIYIPENLTKADFTGLKQLYDAGYADAQEQPAAETQGDVCECCSYTQKRIAKELRENIARYKTPRAQIASITANVIEQLEREDK